jgi:two-component system, NarL family, sensor histidine kinase UhpB
MSLSSLSVMMAGGAIICLLLAVYAWRRGRSAAARSLAFLLLSASVWALFYGLEFALTSQSHMRVALALQYPGIATVSVFWFLFASRYSSRARNLSSWRVALLFLVPAITVGMVVTNDLHHLYYTSIAAGVVEGHTYLVLSAGPFYWIHICYSYCLLVVGSVFMIRALFEALGTGRLRVGLLLMGVLLPFVVNVAYIAGVRPYGFVDLTPVAFVITGIAFTLGVFTIDLFDIYPVARDTLFDSIPDAVIVLDACGSVAAANPAARGLLESGFVIDGRSETCASVGEEGRSEPRWPDGRDIEVGDRTYHRRDSALTECSGRLLGSLIVLRDVTARKQAERELERNRDEYQSLVNNLPGATYRCSQGALWTKQYVSVGIESLSGYPASDFVNDTVRSFGSMVHPDDVARVERQLDEALQDGSPWEFEYRIIQRDGGVRWVLDKGQAVIDEAGGDLILNGLLLDITQQKQARLEVEQSHRDLRKLAAHLQVVREEERAAVAWELHDEIGQALAVVKMDVAAFHRRLPSEVKVEAGSGLGRAESVLDETITRLRRLYSDLRPGMLDDLGLSATIEWQTGEFARFAGIDCRITRLDTIAFPDERSNLAVYRVFQELLYDVVRYSGATEAAVQVERHGDRALVRVSDNGSGTGGLSKRPEVSLRYAAMRERLHDCHGTFTVHKREAGGTVAEISALLTGRGG